MSHYPVHGGSDEARARAALERAPASSRYEDPSDDDDREQAQDRAAGRAQAEAEARRAFEQGEYRAVLATLMQTYGDEVYRICFYIVNHRALAEDLRQAVFLQAMEQMRHFEGRSSWRTWLSRIARNRAIDAMRLRKRWLRRVIPADSVPDDPAVSVDVSPAVLVDSSDPIAQIDRPVFAQSLQACLDKLPPSAREMVLLRFVEDLPYGEIARLVEQNPEAVRKRITRALPQLRKCLEQKGDEL